MPLRIGFDMDGTIADFESAFHEVERRLFGPGETMRAGEPERDQSPADPHAGRPPSGPPATPAGPPDDAAPHKGAPDPSEADAARREGAADPAETMRGARQARRRRDAIWSAIQATPNFWESLKPIEPDAVRRIHTLMIEHRWEVFFITQRPKTAGDTVQRQTQRWLVAHGFDLPSVLVLGGSRGAAAGALRLDYHVDDSAQNCLDVLADSRAKPLLIVPSGPDQDAETLASARKLGIGTAPSIGAALDVLTEASTARHQPGVLARLAALVGWR
jgi:hypothetical protein